MSHVTKPLFLASVAGLLLFLVVQILIPLHQTESVVDPSASPALLTKKEASDKALAFVQDLNRLHGAITPEKNMAPTVSYRTQSTVAGYFNKENLTATYQKWESASPYDTYQVSLYAKRGTSSYIMHIDVHMTSGRIIGFELKERPSATARLGWNIGNKETGVLVEEPPPAMDTPSRNRLSAVILAHMGWDVSQLKLNQSASQPDAIEYSVPAAHIGQARLNIQAGFSPQGYITMLNPLWSIPDSYQTEERHQKTVAKFILIIGYIWMSILMSIISIFYCIWYRRDIRFGSKTLLSLSVVSCAITLLHLWNSFHLGTPLDQADTGLPVLVVKAAITVIQGIILYFSFHAGKRLWSLSAYKEVLPTWRHAAFGDKLIRSFWVGTAYTGILLGVQTIIFFVLESGFHTWSTTDASDSPINLRIIPLYPMLAWMAAISEEGSRLFGVGLLQRWLRNPWISGIIPTLIWAFAHVTYPIFPYYSRPIELLFIGMIFLFIMLKHNWWTAMFAHLIFDTLLLSLPFLMRGTVRDFSIGVVYLLLPAAIVYVLALLHRNRQHRFTSTT